VSVADNSILRVAAKFILDNASDIINIYHFVMDAAAAVDEDDVLDDCLALIEDLMANVYQNHTTSLVLDEVEVWVRNVTLDRWDRVGAIDGTWTGGVAGYEYLPVGTGALVTADTVDSHARGRKYLPPGLEGHLNSGEWISTAITNLVNFLGDYVATYVGTYAEWIPGIWQEATKSFQMFIGSGTTTNTPAYQRRRKPGVGG
jgi:hypothetical protein